MEKVFEQRQRQLLSLYNTAIIGHGTGCKLHRLKEIISKKVLHPLNPENQKIMIFTAFADTADYLYENLKEFVHGELHLNIAVVTGSGLTKTTLKLPGYQNDFNAILTCFAPRAKQRNTLTFLPQDKEIDIMIATDCISEGQNLQDCDYVSITTSIESCAHNQRGRIDRINSPS